MGRTAVPFGNIPPLFAHRGCSTKAPENTLTAFRIAGEHGVPGIELDVQLCATGELVVFHDLDLSRIAGIPSLVAKLPFQELRSIDIGSWFAPAFGGERIPLLTEVFDLLGDSVFYDIEIKHRERHPIHNEKALTEIIRMRKLQQKCIVSSFNPFSLKALRRIAPEIRTALIYAVRPEVPKVLQKGQGQIITRCGILKPHFPQVTPAAMFRMKKLGRRLVLPWTVNDPDTARSLFKLGVDGIISDRAEELMYVRSSIQPPTTGKK